MTSTAKVSSQLWKVPRILPTLPTTVSTHKFFAPRSRRRDTNNNNEGDEEPPMQTQFLSSFEARIHPISPILKPPATYASGPVILRAFLHARTRHGRTPFRMLTDQSLEAVYDSMRIDGLPRVVFAVGKDVEQGLRGKLHGYLRGKFKRRGRVAFRLAMEEIRKQDPLWRCDLDILFIIKKQSMLNPFPMVVEEMKKCLLKVNPKVVAQGLKNTNMSQQYMSDRTKKPRHVLKVLAQEMGVDTDTPEQSESLRKDLIDERNRQIDKIRWDDCTVTGRYHDVQLHENGTMIPLDTNEMTRKMDAEEGSTTKSLRDAMSFKELREMFPAFPVRALRRYAQSYQKVSRPNTTIYEKTSTQTSVNLPARNFNSQDTSPSQPSPNDIEEAYNSTENPSPPSSSPPNIDSPDPLPPPSEPSYQDNQFEQAQAQPRSHRHRESFEVREPYSIRKRRQFEEVAQSTPFKSSIRSQPDIPHLSNQETAPTDETFDYLFGDEAPSPARSLRATSERGYRSSRVPNDDNFSRDRNRGKFLDNASEQSGVRPETIEMDRRAGSDVDDVNEMRMRDLEEDEVSEQLKMEIQRRRK